MTQPPVHDAAARGFERGAGDYERGRPGYPDEVVARLRQEGVLDPTSVVVDVGAGTGKFSRLLFPHVAEVVAVEPVAAMRSTYAANHPGRRVVDGTAESLPLGDATVDVATVAQAFHWFAGAAAVIELARVLRPEGWLVLVWNTRDETSPWTAAIGALMDRLAGDAPRFRSRDRTWQQPLEASGSFGAVASATFANPVIVDLPTMLARVSSTSYVSALPDDRRAEVLAEVTTLLEEGPIERHGGSFVEPYLTELFWCRRH